MSRFSIWQRIPLRVQGLIFNSLPLVAILVTAVFAYFSNQQRERTEMSLNRHFEMVENLVDIHTALLKAEAGLRGNLLTHDPALLQPAVDAHTLIPQKLARVRTLMESIPKPNMRAQKLAQLDAVQDQVNAELHALANVSAASNAITPTPRSQQPNPARSAAPRRRRPAIGGAPCQRGAPAGQTHR